MEQTKKWLDIYFSGKEPNFTPPLHPIGSDFRREVWDILLKIPDGKTITYGDIAREREIAGKKALQKCLRGRCAVLWVTMKFQ